MNITTKELRIYAFVVCYSCAVNSGAQALKAMYDNFWAVVIFYDLLLVFWLFITWRVRKLHIKEELNNDR